MELFEYTSVSEFPLNIHLTSLDSSELDLFVVFGEDRVILVLYTSYSLIVYFLLGRYQLLLRNLTGISKIKVKKSIIFYLPMKLIYQIQMSFNHNNICL